MSRAEDPVNILLVDDQPGKLLAYEAMLGGLGERLIKANSGKEALELLLRTEVPIVLMDVSMPDLDGFELAEIIRQHPRYQKTAIIFVSAVHLTDMDRLKGYESGAVDYVSVPVVPELLRAKVKVFAELYRKTREYERLNRELEARVAERTASLEAAAVKQLELTERLREADRRKDEFLAFLGHELRNPLAPILNAASIMRPKVEGDADLSWCRDVIERQTRHLTRLVDDLLDVARITAGRITLQTRPVDVSSIVATAVEASRPLIDRFGHQISVAIPDQPLVLQGDPARLTQILANLLNNAAKYQDPGGRIDVAIERDGADAVLTVVDRGFGIAPEILPSIFDLFSRIGRTGLRADDGLGIGLALVRKLTELHGGTIAAESAGHRQGSRFTVRLPRLVEVDEPAQATSVGSKPTATAESRDGTKSKFAERRILVVDDNRDSADSIVMLLKLFGAEVDVAYDGPTSLEAIDAHRPDTVILDIGLPGMDGYEVARRIRRRKEFDDITLIALTGWGQPADRRKTKDAGFQHHLVKPVDPDVLQSLLAAVVKEREGSES